MYIQTFIQEFPQGEGDSFFFFERIQVWIFSSIISFLIGLEMKSSMPWSRHFWRSSSVALAVRAIIGVRLILRSFSILRISWVA